MRSILTARPPAARRLSSGATTIAPVGYQKSRADRGERHRMVGVRLPWRGSGVCPPAPQSRGEPGVQDAAPDRKLSGSHTGEAAGYEGAWSGAAGASVAASVSIS